MVLDVETEECSEWIVWFGMQDQLAIISECGLGRLPPVRDKCTRSLMRSVLSFRSKLLRNASRIALMARDCDMILSAKRSNRRIHGKEVEVIGTGGASRTWVVEDAC